MAQNIFNSVSSRPAIGDEDQGINDDPSIKKIYHGSTVVYENAHAAIENNSITHPWWEADTRYVASDAKGQSEWFWNGHQSMSDFSSLYTEDWGHWSPLFAQSTYESYVGRYYLYRFNVLDPGDHTSSSHDDVEHVDLARTTTGWTYPRLTGSGIGATAQKRILLMHGAGNILMSGLNKDVDRSYPAIPITSCTTASHSTIDSGDTNFSTEAAERWYFAQMFTSVTAPDDATQATFGCYVRQPSDDPLRTNNGGCVQLKQIKDGTFSGQQAGQVDNIIIRGDSSSKLTNLTTGTITNQQAHYQWSGPQHESLIGSRGINQWNDQVVISAHQFVDAADCDNFKKVERTVSLASGTGRKYNFAVGFLENHANLHLSPFSSYGPTGAVWFYNCFVVFS